MPDFTITVRRDRVYIHAETPKAEKWIAVNAIAPMNKSVVAVNREFLEDYIEELRKADLTAEVL